MSPTTTPSPAATLSQRWQIIILLLLAAAFFAAQAWVTHSFFTTQLPGGNDFYPRWYGTQQLLLEGRNPYDSAVTREIEAVLDPLNQQTNSFNFAFPLNVSLTLFPLVGLDYAWAQALWIVTIIWLACGAMLLLQSLAGWRITPWSVLAILLFTLTFYPVVRTIFLGQFTVHVTFLLVLGLWLRKHHYELAAGLLLSLATIKPQLLILLLPWLGIWFLYRREWRSLIGLIAGGVGQLLITLIMLPTWPADFLRGLGEYADRAGGRNLMQIVLGWLPAGILPTAVTTTSLALLLLFVYQIRQPLLALIKRQGPPAESQEVLFWQGTFWALIVTALVPFQTGTTNQVLLLIPFMMWGALLVKRGQSYLFWLAAVLVSLFLWLLFRGTLHGAAESELMFLPLPLLAFACMWLYQWRLSR